MLAFAALSFMYFGNPSSMPAELRILKITLPDQVRVSPEGSFAISPDGRCLAFAAQDSDGVNRIWIQELDSLAARPLRDTGSKSNYIPPFFWSPDSRFIAYDAGGLLMKVDISGKPPVKICDLPGYAIGGTWNRDGVIIYPTLDSGLMRVSAADGISTPLTHLNEERQERWHLYPVFLPDGRHFLYVSISIDPDKLTFNLCLGSLDARPEEQVSRKIVESYFMPVYVPSLDSGPGHILFLQEQTLMALPFDSRRLEKVGEPLFVTEGVGSFMAFGFFSASTDGTLVYRRGVTNQWNRPAWFDRVGNPLGIAGDSGQYYGLSLSPNDSQAAVGWRDMAQTPSFTDIWLLDLERDNPRRRTFGEGNNPVAVWSFDGSSIIFASDRDNGVANLYRQSAGGIENEHLFFESKEDKYPSSWSSDGRFVLFTVDNPKTKGDLWVLRTEDKHAWPLLDTESNEIEGRFSEDMRWIAYQSDKTGRNEIYVGEFLENPEVASLKTGGQEQISRGGGTGPRWARKDKELYFHDPNGTVMVAEITPGALFHAGAPKSLFPAPPDLSIFFTHFNTPVWDVTGDGNRFLLQELAAESSSEPFTVVLNWTKLLNP
jgi:Tol biopolymer transport system component